MVDRQLFKICSEEDTNTDAGTASLIPLLDKAGHDFSIQSQSGTLVARPTACYTRSAAMSSVCDRGLKKVIILAHSSLGIQETWPAQTYFGLAAFRGNVSNLNLCLGV